ncbi:NAD(P)/FAD-dependent oxidoreductase [Streptomyces beijiangensis]|uniref:Tryptophan 7-halogenase n=1 Tax=Streptomyces beijiangensis TaxID=163361 RepID=A0A939FBY5_9ACTN|nr:tryptophan 7-halogenase [Streptomyces beijiangensis]MBO0516456.1 tryptophan 7-halogenase [Streptomyces beijiangensis]
MDDIAATERTTYDVAILGSGMAGSLLAAILARQGTKVLLLDGGSHPRFAIGESTIPYTLVTLRTLAERYDVPEISALASFTETTKALGPRFGVKRHFGFLLHHENTPQNPREVNEFNTPPQLLHEAAHYFRQDVDAYLFQVAAKYGTTVRQNFFVDDVDFDGSGVTLSGRNGEYRARYVVDASGFRSPLADKFDLREETTRFKHHSRSMWNHMLNVTPTDRLFDHLADHLRPPVPWYEGTVHHMFERGWAWVIAFDNNKWSTNPLCSVGMTVDPRVYPKIPGMSAAEDFARLAAPFPDIARQYEGAIPTREWISTDRLQYSSKTTIGDRWMLLSHAAGFIDPLFSRGLSNTTEAINVLAYRLLRAVKDDDFSAERFRYVDRLQQSQLDANDELVNAAFISWADYGLWSAIFRIWGWGANAGVYRLQDALTKFRKDGREEHFLNLEDAPNPGLYWPDHDGFAGLHDLMVKQTDAVEAGTTSGPEAADVLYEEIERANYVPKHLGFAEREVRFINPNPKKLYKMVRWAAKEGDPEVARLLTGNAREAIKAKLRGGKLF